MSPQQCHEVKTTNTFVDVPLEDNLPLADVVDFHLEHNPDKTCYACAEPDGTLREITYREFGRAVHRAAHALRPAQQGADGAVVAIIALSDTVLYHAITIGLMKAGLVPFPISPRLAAPAVANLLRTSGSRRLVTTQQTLHTLVSELKAELGEGYGLVIDEVPALDTIYPHLAAEKAKDAFEPYPAPAVAAKPEDMQLYLHSSGSTGFPKAIGHTRASIQGWTKLASVTDIRRFTPRPRFASHILPAFHGFGFWAQLLIPLYGGAESALFYPVVRTPTEVPPPPTPDAQLDAARASKSTAVITVPAYVHQWAEDPSAVEYLSTLQVLVYGGGPLSEPIGEILATAGVKLRSILGATEFGVPSHCMPTHEEDWNEWRWIELDANAAIEWEKQEDGTEELIIPADGDHWHMPAVKNMAGRPGYATNDLWVAHPTKPYLRRIVGRKDDVIVHSTGEKTVPAPMEGTILKSPLVAAVVMFGRGRDEAGILVEPAAGYAVDTKDDAKVAAYRDAIWYAPVVEEANQSAPAYSRIFKELILVAHSDAPLPRTDKGTVVRKRALQLYNDEIEKLYEALEDQGGERDVAAPASWNAADVEGWLVKQIRDITGRDMDRAVDLFEQGFDSLNNTVLRNRILGALKADTSTASAASKITQNIVYAHPSIEKLATFLSKLARGDTSEGALDEASVKQTIIAMAAKHSEGLPGYVDATTLPKYIPATAVKPELPVTILMTGTTGNLGADMLAQLLRDERVSRVYTVERAAGAMERQRVRFEDKGLDVGMLESGKLVSLEGDVCKERLGQSEEVYAEMLSSVSLIFHVAWRLDFNLGITAFEPNIRSTRALLDFARASAHARTFRFIFTNSIGATLSWDHTTKGPVPEELLEDPSVAIAGGGYGHAKYAAERVLAAGGVPFTSVRVGQITGDAPRGAWATTDWFPILVKTSLALGVLPSDAQEVSWLPSNAVAGTLIDAAFNEKGLAPSHNIVHPHPIQWSEMIEDVQRSLKNQLDRDLPIVPFPEWFAKLEAVAADPFVSALDVPGVKLLEFFRGMSGGYGLGKFATDKMTAVSETLRDLHPLGQADADAWVGYWKEKGLLA
ncbi:acetyl-CoA synthetase-like protein [Schizophyllum commune Loenen D]|nr:acetyl-CoA synthetase-like protein [Schizophyllum commune Loenen D]